MLRLNLGCGSNIKPDFINIDLEPQSSEVKAHDLRMPLPYKDGTVDLIFSEHFIEHVSREDFVRMAKDWYRVLKPGGWIRISTPDLRALVDNYRLDVTTAYQSVGWLPQSSCQMMNGGMRLWGHQFLYDWHELSELMAESKFYNIRRTRPRDGEGWDFLSGLETRPDCGDLVALGQKPGGKKWQ